MQQAHQMIPSPVFEPLLTAEEVAGYLRCHLKTVQKMAREGRIPSIRCGKRHLFRLSDIDRWLKEMHSTASDVLN